MLSMEYIKENKNYYEEKINELNDKVKYYQNKTQRQNKEIERLNNIINELEKDLLEKQEFYRNELSTRPTNDSEHNTKFADNCALTQIDVILDKLKELKEGK